MKTQILQHTIFDQSLVKAYYPQNKHYNSESFRSFSRKLTQELKYEI